MSSSLRPLAELPRLAKLPSDMADLTLPSLSSWSDHYHSRELFSPPYSSSPPRTPYNTRHTYDDAHIQSSPRLGPASGFRTATDHYEDPHTIWHRFPTPHLHSKSQPHHPTSLVPRSTFMYKQRYSAASDFDASDYSENMETDIVDIQSDRPTQAPLRSPTSFSDSLDEEEDDGPGFSFSELGIRTMCFRTSAERGRWKTDPIPHQQSLLLSTRKSAPANDSTTDVQVTSRPISEPAPSIPPSVTSPYLSEIDKRRESTVPEVTSASSPTTLPSLPTSPGFESMEPLPPLTSDRDSSMDADEILTPSSPLPPSSPPPFSPAISLVHLHTQSTPSINSTPSSPLIAPSSPLSPISSEIGEEDAYDLTPTDQGVTPEDLDEGLDQDGASATPDLDLTPTPHDQSACVSSQSDIIKYNLPQSEAQVTPSSVELSPPTLSKVPELVIEVSSFHCVREKPAEEDVTNLRPYLSQLLTTPEVILPRRISPSPQNTHPSKPAALAENTATSAKRPKHEQDSVSSDGPARKRVKTSDGVYQNAAASSSTEELHEDKPKAAVKKRRKHPATSENSTSKKRRSKCIAEESDSESFASSSTSSRASSVAPPRLVISDGIKRDKNGIAAEDAEICGMIIEGMATSRASSLPISQICKIVLQSRPSMRAQQEEEKDWHTVFRRVLQSGVTGQGSGVFGKVDSSYKDDNNPAAEARWFYVPEMDCDQERASLIRSMMPRPGKRSVTKRYKQYYYQPLDKISRWDPEDDL